MHVLDRALVLGCVKNLLPATSTVLLDHIAEDFAAFFGQRNGNLL